MTCSSKSYLEPIKHTPVFEAKRAPGLGTRIHENRYMLQPQKFNPADDMHDHLRGGMPQNFYNFFQPKIYSNYVENTKKLLALYSVVLHSSGAKIRACRITSVIPNSKTKSRIKCSNGYFLTKWFMDKYLVKYYLNPISGYSAMQDQVTDGRPSVYG